MQIERLVEILRSQLSTVMRAEDFDITPGQNDNELDVSTDAWTIHLEGKSGFLAIDDEPGEPSGYTAARRAVMSERVEFALAVADRELDGMLSAVLSASGDPFTLDLVNSFASHRDGGAIRSDESSSLD